MWTRCRVLRWPTLLAVAVVFAEARGAGLDFPGPPDACRVSAFLANCGDADAAVVQSWQGLELAFDPQGGGLDGRLLTCTEVAVLGRPALAERSMVAFRNAPSQRIRHFEVAVTGPDGVRRWSRKDLKWSETTEQGDGIVILDGSISVAFVPGVRVGDRIRVTAEYRIQDWRGVPPVQLGAADTPSLDPSCELLLPPDHEIIWTSSGPDRFRERLREIVTEEPGRHAWVLADEPTEERARCGASYPQVGLVPQIAAVGGTARPSMAIGQDWASVGGSYLETIEPRFAIDDTLSTVAAAITRGAVDPVQKIDRIYAWVQRRCHYLGLFSGSDDIIPRSARSVYDLGSGDCKGLGALLIAMLRSAGIPAYPVLVMTTSRGRLATEVPNLLQFDHFIVWADDGVGGLFLDGTVDHCPAGTVPATDAGSPVLLLKPGAVGLVEIPNSAWAPGAIRRTIEGRLHDDGHLEFLVTCTFTGGQALEWRNRLAGQDSASVRRMLRPLLEPSSFAADVSRVTVAALDDRQAPLVVSMSQVSGAPLPRAADRLFLPRRMLADLLPEPPAPACDDRTDWRGLPECSVMWRLTLPDGFDLAATDSLTLSAPGLQWIRNCRQDGRELRVNTTTTTLGAMLSVADIDALGKLLVEIRRAETGYIEILRH